MIQSEDARRVRGREASVTSQALGSGGSSGIKGTKECREFETACNFGEWG